MGSSDNLNQEALKRKRDRGSFTGQAFLRMPKPGNGKGQESESWGVEKKFLKRGVTRKKAGSAPSEKEKA